MKQNREVILSVKNLKQYFHGRGGTVKAVDDISFNIYKGEVFGLVGESGSGKSTTGRSIIRLYKPLAGEIIFQDEDISGRLTRSKKAIIKLGFVIKALATPIRCLCPPLNS